MPVLARDIIRRCVDTLQDKTSVRWTVDELVRYLNDGQREVVLYRPDATATNATITCAPGFKQTIPSNGSKLIDVLRNATGSYRAVRAVSRELLDAQIPNWYTLPGTVDIVHFMYDPRDPKVFYIYPPATASTITPAKLDIVYSAYPAEIAEPAEGQLYSAVVGNIGLPDIYANVLQDYILYRAFSKDGEYAGNAARAQAHYNAFATALGIEIKSTVAVALDSVSNLNRPPSQPVS